MHRLEERFHRYLKNSEKSDPELSVMLERAQIVALKGPKSAKYKQMRKELIERLGQIWLEGKS